MERKNTLYVHDPRSFLTFGVSAENTVVAEHNATPVNGSHLFQDFFFFQSMKCPHIAGMASTGPFVQPLELMLSIGEQHGDLCFAVVLF